MQRRQFMGMAAGALAAGVLGGYATRAAAGNSAAAGASMPLDVAQFRTLRRFAKTRFGDIAYVERGTGPAALFLHAHPLNGFQWRGALDRLSEHRRCIAPDFLGLGYTRVAEEQGVAPAAQAAMLMALLDKLGIPTVDIVANDSGDAVAQLLAARHPQRVRTLLLTNGDEEHDSPPPTLKPLLALARAGKSTDVFPGWLADKASARVGFGGAVYADPAILTDEAIDYYFSPLISSLAQRALVDATLVGFEPNPLAGIGPALKRCKAPTRIVWGMADTIFSPDSPDRLDRSFGNSRGVRRLANSKAFWPEELPDVIAEEARQLWDVA
ncbi:alpha/beta hydrolase [Lysobacter sp. CFH 32150]|uniref:alpha/beta fold hydrolase n=1 Tax=Lysobacter sp. CFH 32150 TaxID=2927128 RepID=UPI001FA7A977|nr:alpha/beta hydrolase [Lysobacter sp. CFH 32150]MCI4566649.1 alpha/beta hydrolase [Lysobacter sp. CFH 32150]